MKYLITFILSLTLGLFAGNLFFAQSAQAFRVSDCQNIYAPTPESFEANVAKKGTLMATFKWFEETEGTWVLKMDTDPRGGHESWVTEYPKNWGVLFAKPVELPQTVVEYTCPTPTPKPDGNKSVKVEAGCDGAAVVTIYGGNTRRTWRVDGVEKWVEKYATVEFSGTIDSVIEWNHDGNWELANEEEYVTRNQAKDCEPEVTSTPTPGNPAGPGNCNGCDEKPTAYQCPNGKVLEVPQALFVHRLGTQATVTWFRTAGDQATILYRETGHSNWEHALRDQVNNDWNSYTIYALNPVLGYDFGVYQHNSCGDGTVAVAVVVDGPKPVIYPFSHWELVK